MLLKSDLTGQGLRFVPAQIPANLSWLVLDNNQIESISADILPTSLQFLSLVNNRLTSLSALGLQSCKESLKGLNLAQNYIVSLDGLSSCLQLKELNLAQNKITDTHLERGISGLKKLRRLDASSNMLRNCQSLFDALKSSRNLKSLCLSNNQFGFEMRIDIGRHHRLREL